ncbi:lipoprotein BA_5634 family protein [Heyndrickxia sp. NPDC080065]|uniref:lipoprotein BA_5634 family protein n=1 Tax=Heyndrickxia sp. NPDC080065 TaxID=3390568 RepID=UPI003CFE0619
MKKLLSVCVTAMLAGSLLTGCSETKEKFTKANGVVLYGDQNQVENIFDQEKEDLKEKAEYKIKVADAGDQKVMILDETTAKALVDKDLFKEVKKDDETEAISSLPEVKKGNAVLFAKEEVNELNLDEKKLKVSYEGNKIIGDGRSYVDMFLIVDDNEWSSINGEKKTMGMIKYEKDPKKKMIDFKVDTVQLVKIG